MLTDYSSPLVPKAGAPTEIAAACPPVPAGRPRWQYQAMRGMRTRFLLAVLASLGIHAAVFFGVGPSKKVKPKPVVDDGPVIELRNLDIKDLEEPERVVSDNDTPVDTATFAPLQPDLPQIATASDFVQQIDFNSLIEKPDMSAAKVFTIPDNIAHGASIKQNIGAIFNLADLDRIPEAIVRPPPIFPRQYKNEVTTATVRVQFIVDANGQVLNVFAVDSTHSGFNDAAVSGVSKWKFRPGWKNGRKVNTRMEVPIVFKITEDL